MSSALIIFTSKQLGDVIKLGGTGWWKVDPVKARSASHVVLTHNAHDKRRPGLPEQHGESFLIAKIRDLAQDDDGRWLIQFSEFAEIDAAYRWPGYRNPVTYVDTEEILGTISIGEWLPMADVAFEDAQALRQRDDASVARIRSREGRGSKHSENEKPGLSFGEIIELHRKRLAADLGVETEAVRVSIEAN